MRHSRRWLAGAVAAIAAATAACSRTAPPHKPLPPTACERRIITADDMSDLLAAPVEMKTIAGDPQSCELEGSNSSSVRITLRPGLGDVSVEAWASGKMPVSGVLVTGVGDKAVWQDTLSELIATKNNALCDIAGQRSQGSEADLRAKFAALCSKIWAAQ